MLKFIFYFVYKIKKIINQMDDSGENEEKVEEKKPKSVSIGRLGRHLSQKRGDTKSGFSETVKKYKLSLKSAARVYSVSSTGCNESCE